MEQPVSDPSTPTSVHGEFVQSLARGLSVIRAFDGDHPELSLSDVARRTGLTRAAARRFLLTLRQLGYVSNIGRGFALTPRVLELGFSYLSALSLPDVLEPHLKRLSHEVDESVSAAVLDGAEIVYIARVPAQRIMSVRISIGTRFPAYVTSMGRVLLAGLAEAESNTVLEESALEPQTPKTLSDQAALREELRRVRANGWSLVDGELELGLRSIAAPVHDATGSVIAAINISSSASRQSRQHVIDQQVPALLRTVAAIDADVNLV